MTATTTEQRLAVARSQTLEAVRFWATQRAAIKLKLAAHVIKETGKASLITDEEVDQVIQHIELIRRRMSRGWDLDE